VNISAADLILWAAMALLAIGFPLALRRDLRDLRARLRAARGRCTKCGYDLTGNVSGRCPECGEPIPRR